MSSDTLRRLLHAGSASVLILIPFTSWTTFRLLLGMAGLLAVTAECLRLLVPEIRDYLSRAIPVFRETEERKPSGAMWLAIGFGVAVLFSPLAATGGVLVAAIADPLAAWVGAAGRVSRGKTWRGSAAHLLAAVVVLFAVGVPIPAVIGGAVVGTALERWPGPFNDNLLVAPSVAGTVSLLI